MEMALIENIQREDLNSLEIALAYQHLIEQYELTQERLSERVGKKRTTIANYLRLLKLPAPIQVALKNKEIDMGHARALLALDDPKTQIRIFNEIITLVKETSVVSYIALMINGKQAWDLLGIADKQGLRTGYYMEFVLTAALLYLIVVMILSLIQKFIERRLRTSDKR